MTLREIIDAGLAICEYPHPCLRRACVPVREVDDDIRLLAARMFELMYEHKGCGLAAPQVGVPLRMFVVNPSGDPARKDLEAVYINPEYVKTFGTVHAPEGCLSLLPLSTAEIPIPRHTMIEIAATGLDGVRFVASCSMRDVGYRSRLCQATQHELDHLQGVLYVDHAPPAAKAWVAGMLGYMEEQFRWKVEKAGKSPPMAELEGVMEAFLAEYAAGNQPRAANILEERNDAATAASPDTQHGGTQDGRIDGSDGGEVRGEGVVEH